MFDSFPLLVSFQNNEFSCHPPKITNEFVHFLIPVWTNRFLCLWCILIYCSRNSFFKLKLAPLPSVSPFKLVLYRFDIPSLVFCNLITFCFCKIILYISCPKSEISHYSKEPKSLRWELIAVLWMFIAKCYHSFGSF